MAAVVIAPETDVALLALNGLERLEVVGLGAAAVVARLILLGQLDGPLALTLARPRPGPANGRAGRRREVNEEARPAAAKALLGRKLTVALHKGHA